MSKKCDCGKNSEKDGSECKECHSNKCRKVECVICKRGKRGHRGEAGATGATGPAGPSGFAPRMSDQMRILTYDSDVEDPGDVITASGAGDFEHQLALLISINKEHVFIYVYHEGDWLNI